MGNVAMRALRVSQANINVENEELEIDLDLGDDNADNMSILHPSLCPKSESRMIFGEGGDRAEGVGRAGGQGDEGLQGAGFADAETEAAKKSVEDLWAEKEHAEKAMGSSSGMDKQAVTTLIRKNLAWHQAKWNKEREKLIAIGNNLVKESFENALAELSLKNLALFEMGCPMNLKSSAARSVRWIPRSAS
ncbi:holo-ACP synthase [Sesbania bispinosa]|nr:holo-ACP synthase [Sesbania bispinosa]